VAARNDRQGTVHRTPTHRASLPYSASRHYIKVDIRVV
jgi:hypothetical protein